MKKIEVKKYNVPLNKNSKTANTIELIDIALMQPRKGGKFERAEMLEIKRIRKAVDSAKNGIIEIEDNDYDSLADYVIHSGWGISSDEILRWMDDIEAYGENEKKKSDKSGKK